MADAREMEKPVPSSIVAESEGPHADEAQLVTWDSPEDKENPKNWPKTRKWRATICTSALVLMNTLTSTIISSSLPQIATSLHITNKAEEILVLSIFTLGFAFGPFISSPLSEIHGRIRVLQSWNFLYLIFNTVCGPVNSSGAMLAFRFLAGFFCSSSQGISHGLLSDLFTADERGRAVAVFSIMPLIGPVIGPVVGGVIAQHTSWRWTFYTASLLDAAILVPSLFILEETFAPVLLQRKKKRLEEQATGQRYYTEHDTVDQGRLEVYKTAIIRPIKLLATQPIIQVMALYNAFLYGIVYMLYANFPALWTGIYHEEPQIAGLNYISLFVGALIAAELCTHAIDHIKKHLCAKNNGVHMPEFRLTVMPPATIVGAIGMFLYGWSADYKLHWIVPNAGAAAFMGSSIVCAIAVNMYIIDMYGKFAASALAAISMLRHIFSGFFPIFAPFLYQDLGYGWGNSILGFIALGIGLPAVILLWKFGEALRKRSPYAQDANN